jgi:heavy metal sensor kinase
MKWLALSIRVRLTLWYAGALGVLLLAFAFGVYFFVQRSLTRQLEQLLDDQFTEVSLAVRERPGDLRELAQRGIVTYFDVRSGEQTVFRTSGWERAGLDQALAKARPNRVWSALAADGQPYRVRWGDILSRQQPYRVTVAVSAAAIRRAGHTLGAILLVGLALALTLALAGGYLLAGRVLAPIQAITAKAGEITAERLSERLPVRNARDEIGRLAIVVNDLLRRLDDSFQRLRRFTADASHELRTPLTAIRSVGEVALQGPADAAAYREAIGSILEETARLSQLLDALLTLTRADSERALLRRQNAPLAPVVREAADVLRVLAEEKQQTMQLALDESIEAKIEPHTLRQAVFNLVDNAIKYTPARGEIRLSVSRNGAATAVVEVTDNGPGIAPEERALVFERFYRVDKSRSVERGAGLGLAIARWAVESNGGRIELQSEPGRGSTFRVILPQAARGGRGETPQVKS